MNDQPPEPNAAPQAPAVTGNAQITAPEQPAAAAEPLRECPFCESTDIDREFSLVATDSGHHHEPGCMTCGATAPLAVWNEAPRRTDLERLEALVYVPGLWKCAKCKCAVVSNRFNVARGTMYANKKPQQCPNECGPMWRVTERDAGNELADRLNDGRNDVLEQAAKMCEAYAKAPEKVFGLFAQIAEDVRAADFAADLVSRGTAGKELAATIRGLKGPA